MTHMAMAVVQDDERHGGGTAGELLHDRAMCAHGGPQPPDPCADLDGRRMGWRPD
jgi:hypothetical protein